MNNEEDNLKTSMKTYIVYKDFSDHSRAVREYVHDFNKQTGRDIDLINPESADGESFCSAYGVVEYPTVVAVADDGQMQRMWVGLPLPTIMEISYYA